MANCPNCRLEVEESASFCLDCGTKLLPPIETKTHPIIGRTLNNKYRVLEFIGSGSMGTVYLGEHIGLRKKVALKVLHRNLGVGDEELHRFQREGIAAGQFNHPNAIQIFDFDRDGEDTFYLAMEYVEGVTLRDYLAEEGPRSTTESAGILRQVLNALGEAHRNGIVHRDLKPDNVMVIKGTSENVTVKVLDFGMSKIVDRPMDLGLATVPGRIIGTPLYMAPEQATGGDVDQRADLYAAGLLMFELLTGVRPFQGETITELFIKQASEPVPSLVNDFPHISVPEGLDEVLGQALEKRRDDRFQTAGAMLRALDGCLTNRIAKPGRAPRRRATHGRDGSRTASGATRRRGPRKALTTVGGLLLISALASAAWHFAGKDIAPPPRVSMKSPQDRTADEARYVTALDSARASLAEGHAEQALADIERARAMQIADSEALLLRGHVHRSRGDADMAIADYREALGIDPGYAEAANSVGWVQVDQDELSTALASFRDAAKRDPSSAESLTGQGVAIFLLGDFEQAERLLTEAVEQDPSLALTHQWLGQLALQAGRPEDAQQAFVNARRQDPRSWRALAGLGAAYLLQGRHAEAERQLGSALLIRPDDPEILADLACVFLELGRPADAITLLSPKRTAGSARLAVLKGTALLSAGRTQDAITELERALGLGLEDPTIHVLLGVVQHQLGDTTAAWAQYEAAIAIDPRLPMPHQNLGLLAFELERYEDAERELNAAYLIDTELPSTNFALGVLYMDYLPNPFRAIQHLEFYIEQSGKAEDARVRTWVEALRRL